jgi:PTH1 family peptidyl-tRNA hydrolase
VLGRLLGRTRDTDVPSDVWVIAGLGNPGPEYAPTRHNLGYLVVDELLRRSGRTLRPAKSGRGMAAEARLGDGPGERAVLVRARGYMNDSGGSVSAMLGYYKATPEKLVVIHDELDIPYGDLRIKFGGGDSGHNGVRSVRKSLGTGDFYRVRVGIGRPPGRQDPADFVLKPFSAAERRDLELNVQRAADCVEMLVVKGLVATQNQYHG